jgi:hypothetical protein
MVPISVPTFKVTLINDSKIYVIGGNLILKKTLL